ncbi:hypothetical protein [Streptomyces antibioticus]|uniref:hypothetical protein n=1 Tax=Streptomyces antibioticus TaxID=1890 RepID=UPI0036ADDCF1
MALDTDTFDIFRTGRRRSHGAPALAWAESTVRDVTSLAAAYVAARLLRERVAGVVAHRDDIYVQAPKGTFDKRVVSGGERCRHPPRLVSSGM